MNKKLMIVLLAGMIFSIPAMAQHPGNTNLDRELKKKLNHAMVYPDFARGTELKAVVTVRFEIANCGSLQILEMDGSHPGVAEYVKEKIESISVAPHERSYEERVFRFTFRQEA